MSIWFGWSRTQPAPLMTDDGDVDDAPSASDVAAEPAPPTPGPLDALRDATTSSSPSAPNEAFLEVWKLHQHTIDADRKAHRLLAGAKARSEYHEALVAEADALNKLGFENFNAFAAVHGAQPPVTGLAPVSNASQTVARIRVLLSELGVAPGDDPLRTAKEFLERVESAPSSAESEAAADKLASALGAPAIPPPFPDAGEAAAASADTAPEVAAADAPPLIAPPFALPGEATVAAEAAVETETETGSRSRGRRRTRNRSRRAGRARGRGRGGRRGRHRHRHRQRPKSRPNPQSRSSPHRQSRR